MTEVTRKEALSIAEKIHKIGLPNADNIAHLKQLLYELDKMTLELSSTYHLAVKQMEKIFEKIEAYLEHEGTVPIKMYTTFNKRLILLESTLK